MAGILTRIVAVLMLLSLTACGDDRPEKITQLQQLDSQRLQKLARQLDDGQIRNAMLLAQYSQILSAERPQLKPLLNEMAKDSTPQGPMFSALKQRLQDAANAGNFPGLDEQLQELQNIYQATDPSQYNDMLSDQVNVVADMSDGKLARVNAISQESSTVANQAEDFGPGKQLVGNPSYGQWTTGSNGVSFWEWYGMYAMFSNIFNRPIYYDNWSRSRDYSYYNDVGRYRYTSPKQASSQDQLYQRTKKRFDSQGKRFDSPYAKSRTGASALSRQSVSSPKQSPKAGGSKFRSNYAKDSSFRNSGFRTSRGISRGK
ncbi:hypothetical protein [Shewanella sp. YIC-542]|uniref:hypothetical protein n=1 Tax=Shewanella mytili TaxID=3377111 RepID=UPI00398F2DC1